MSEAQMEELRLQYYKLGDALCPRDAVRSRFPAFRSPTRKGELHPNICQLSTVRLRQVRRSLPHQAVALSPLPLLDRRQPDVVLVHLDRVVERCACGDCHALLEHRRAAVL